MIVVRRVFVRALAHVHAEECNTIRLAVLRAASTKFQHAVRHVDEHWIVDCITALHNVIGKCNELDLYEIGGEFDNTDELFIVDHVLNVVMIVSNGVDAVLANALYHVDCRLYAIQSVAN